MDNKIVELEKYKKDIQNKNNLDNKSITLEELSIEELDGVSKLYRSEIKYLTEDIKKRVDNIERLKQENKKLKKILGRSE